MIRRSAIVLVVAALIAAFSPAPASASILSAGCGLVGDVSGIAGKACNTVTKVVGGGGASSAAKAIGIAAVVVWVAESAKSALKDTAKIISETTTPQLRSTWFSSTYWRMAGIAALLTLPFLFAAAVQAIMQSDLSMLGRAAFGYLPVAMLAVGIAAPLTMLLLSASDEMSTIISSAAGNTGGRLLTGGALGAIHGTGFLSFIVALLAVGSALVVWLELVIREAAVYVIVLMLPLAFAAIVWPARRVWAIRSIELLIALILSKFAIVAVLTLGGGALAQVGNSGLAGGLAGVSLLMLGAFAPWALVKLLPMTEVASSAVGSLRGELPRRRQTPQHPDDGPAPAGPVDTRGEQAEAIVSDMRHQAQDAAPATTDANGASDRVSGAVGAAVRGAAVDPGVNADDPGGSAPGGTRDPSPGGAGGAVLDGGAGNGPREDGNGGGAGSPAGRLPNLDEMWHADNWEWDPLSLGFDENGKFGQPVFSPDNGGGDQLPEPSDPETADDHNPLPERQPPTDEPK
jgi:hypothetical protein